MLFRIFYDDVHRLHSDPYGKHPENPSRLDRALSALLLIKQLRNP
jgi:hypothetical protein